METQLKPDLQARGRFHGGANRVVFATIVAVVTLGIVLPSVARAAGAVEVYRVQHRTAAELLPLAETALAGGGSVAVDAGTNSLVLVGESSAVQAALELLRLQDQARRTVVVQVDSHRVEALDAAGYRIDWEHEAGSLRVGNVFIPGEGTNIRATGHVLSTAKDRTFSSVVRILEGETGRIATGRAVPVRSPGLYGTTTIVEAESGLEASPRILGDRRVQIELTPFEGEVDPAGRVAFRGATTVVVVKPGETVAVGGLQRHGEAKAERVFSARSRREAAMDHILLLRVEVE